MGIKGLNKIINQYAKEAITYENISEFKDSKVAIDSELLLHKFKSHDSENSHIFGFLNNIMWYLKNGIVPVYVFDGSPSAAKQDNIITKRSNYKEQMYKKCEEIEGILKNHPEYNENKIGEALSPDFNNIYDRLYKLQKKMTCMSVTKKHRNECKYLLKLLGIPYITAEEDAEAFCVVLQRKGIVDYVYTEDTDIIPYFIASLVNDGNNDKPIKILRTTNYSKNPYYLKDSPYDNNLNNKYDLITVVNLDIIVANLKMSKESIIDLCIICGCDFCPPIPKMTYDKAYSIIKKYETIENFIHNGIYTSIEFKYKDARDIFYKNYTQHITKSMDLTPMDVDNLKVYLLGEINLNSFLTTSIISKYKKTIETYNLITKKN
jgi:flap endonuclease-1